MDRKARGCAGRWLFAALWAIVLAGVTQGAVAAPSASPYLEDMTWTELRDRIAAGATTALVPIGGTEQSGPYMALGKHNVRARLLAARIATRLGNAVVAPVIAYVPEGAIDPPAAHMRFAGTLSIPTAVFEAVLEATARSLCQHGFHDVMFLGDHGGYQKSEERVAAKLNHEWASRPSCRAHAVLDYYRAAQAGYVDALKARGFGIDEIGTHAGLADTALSLAIDPALVRNEALAHAAQPGVRDGVHGDPRRATAELGELGVARIVDASTAKIRELVRAHRDRAVAKTE